MGTMNKQEVQHPSFTYRTQTGLYTGNEPGPHPSEVCEPEGTDTHLTRTMCTRHKLQMNAMPITNNYQQPKTSKHIAHQLESNTTTNLIKQIVFSLSLSKHKFQFSIN